MGWQSAEDIKNIYDLHSQHSQFFTEIIKHANAPSLQKGSTWLIKRHLERINDVEDEISQTILELIPSLKEWESRLHVLQSLQYLKIPSKRKRTVELFAKSSIEDNNKFVRAWGYSGFYELARQYSTYQDEATSFMEMAMRDEPASVKARIRQVMSKG